MRSNQPDRSAFSNSALIGKPHRCFRPVPVDEWAEVLEEANHKPTGYIRRVRMRTLGEVAGDLYQTLNVVKCDKCGHEKPCKPGVYCEKHKGCRGEYQAMIDEYFHGPFSEQDAREPVPHSFASIACYAVTGGSEGHYVHVEFIEYPEHRVLKEQPNARITRLALGKTFRGMAHAQELVRRCAELLGA